MLKRKINVLLWCNFTWGLADFRYGLYSTLVDMKGVNVFHARLMDDINSVYKIFRPDILISVKGIPSDSLLQQMKKDGCKTVQLFPDDPDRYEQYEEHIKKFDFWYTNSLEALETMYQIMYQKDGFTEIKLCGFAADYDLIKDIPGKKEYQCDIIFAGGCNKKRERYIYLNALKDLDVRVFGKWDKEVYGNQGKFLEGIDYFYALKSAKIGIDFSGTAEGYQTVKSKVFEMAACGLFILSDNKNVEEMEKYFVSGEEINFFDSPQGLRHKCEYFLKEKTKRISVAMACQKKLSEEHTWKNRIDMIFNDVLGGGQ